MHKKWLQRLCSKRRQLSFVKMMTGESARNLCREGERRTMAGMKTLFLTLMAGSLLAGCATSAGVGVGVPVGPFRVGVGMGTGGVSAGVSTGVGPVGVGVGVNQRGQVTGNAGVGVSTSVGGGAHVGAGVGTSTVLHDPHAAPQKQAVPESAAPQQPQPATSAPGAVQWRDAQGNVVPECRIRGMC